MELSQLQCQRQEVRAAGGAAHEVEDGPPVAGADAQPVQLGDDRRGGGALDVGHDVLRRRDPVEHEVGDEHEPPDGDAVDDLPPVTVGAGR